MPPPRKAWLELRMQLRTLITPPFSFRIPPPFSLFAFPLLSVRRKTLTVTALLILKMRKRLAEERVTASRSGPGPSIVRLLLRSGRAESRLIVQDVPL